MSNLGERSWKTKQQRARGVLSQYEIFQAVNNCDIEEKGVNQQIGLNHLPPEILCMIMENLNCHEIAEKREVSKKFNAVCGYVLTSKFKKADDKLNKKRKEILRLMPRRESKRALHKYWGLHRFLTDASKMTKDLWKTYALYIKRHQCPFIPGKVLDVMFSLLRRVRNETKPSMKRRLGILGRRRLLRDLEDYCIMATEHFNDEIAPGFNKAQHQEDAESMLDMREMSNTITALKKKVADLESQLMNICRD